jgi:hypothetical protein
MWREHGIEERIRVLRRNIPIICCVYDYEWSSDVLW